MDKFYLRKAQTKKSAAQYWRAEIEGSTVRMYHGQEGGAEIAEDAIVYTQGKNIGKANETTAEYQCRFEVERRVRKKLENGYDLVEGEITIGSNTAIVSNTVVPSPMLAKKYEDTKKKIDKLETIAVQRKLNGNRCLVNIVTGEMYSRKRKLIPHLKYVLNDILKYTKFLKDKGVVWVDGELYAHGLSFNEVQKIIRNAKTILEEAPKEDTSRIMFNLYDYICPTNSGFFSKAQVLETERLSRKENNSLLTIVQTEFISPSELSSKHDKYVKEGYEGIMIRLDMPYEEGPSRANSLIKHKMFMDEEFKVIAINTEELNKSKLATFTVTDGKITFDVTPAMSDKEKAFVLDNKNMFLGKMATVKYQNRDEETNVPIFATLVGFRDESDLPS